MTDKALAALAIVVILYVCGPVLMAMIGVTVIPFAVAIWSALSRR